jgi:hypothetical protein
MPAETFAIDSRRLARAKRVQTIQHVAAAVILITNGFGHITGHHVTPLAVAEIAAGALLVAAAARDKFRHVRGHGHSKIGWVEIAGAVMMTVEAIEKLHVRHHFLFYVLSFIPPVMLLVFGLFDMKLKQRLRILADDDFFDIRTRVTTIFSHRQRIRWKDAASFRITSDAIEIVRNGGAIRKLSTKDIKNREEAMVWTRAQFLRRGIPERAPLTPAPLPAPRREGTGGTTEPLHKSR